MFADPENEPFGCTGPMLNVVTVPANDLASHTPEGSKSAIGHSLSCAVDDKAGESLTGARLGGKALNRLGHRYGLRRCRRPPEPVPGVHTVTAVCFSQLWVLRTPKLRLPFAQPS